MVPVREMIQRQRENGQRMESMKPGDVRGLRTADFFLRTHANKPAQGTKGKTDEKEWSTESSSPAADDLHEALEELQRPD